MANRIIISNGQVVSSTDVITADVLIEDESIVGVVSPNSVLWDDAQVLDASGKYVLPGLVDPHTHIKLDTGVYRTDDNWEIGTKVAAYGGITTVVDFATQFSGQTFEEALNNRLDEAKDAYIDYSFHMMITDPPADDTTYREALAHLRDLGVPSIKLYTTYRPNYYMDDGALLRTFRLMPSDMLALIHCENDAIVATASEALIQAGKTSLAYHGQSRPMQAEVEAVNRVVQLAELAEANVYIVHCSHAQTVMNLHQQRMRTRKALVKPISAVYFETCPQYFVLDDAAYAGSDPEKYILQPPLRDPASVQQLRETAWLTDVISTDHCDYSYTQKTAYGEFPKTAGGLPGLETSLSLTFSYLQSASNDEKIKKIVQKMSQNPAAIFGLYPRKGALLAGSDADVVIFDPDAETTLKTEQMHTIGGYSPYAGMRVLGRVATTIRRGEVLVHDGEFLGKRGQGMFMKGKPFFNTL